MTCIVGVVDKNNGDVWIGADGRASFGYYQMSIRQPKIARVGEMLIGIAGTPRIAQLLFASNDVPVCDERDPYYFLCDSFSSWAHEKLLATQSMEIEDGIPKTKSHLVVALKQRLFVIDGQFSVYESQRDFVAAGAGLEVASGYLLATPNQEPEERIQGALVAAVEILPSCGAPFHIEKL